MIAGHDSLALCAHPRVRALPADSATVYLALCAAATPGGHVPHHVAYAVCARHDRALATLDALVGADLIETDIADSGVWVHLPAIAESADVFAVPPRTEVTP